MIHPPPFTCVGCGKLHDRAIEHTADRSISPSVGDITLCNRCGTAYEFTEGLAVRLIATEDLPEEIQEVVERARHTMFTNPAIPRDRL